MRLSVQALDAALGAEIDGLDVSTRVPPETVNELREALHTHSVIVLRRQSLTPDQLIRFAGYFGRPQPHIVSHMRLSGYPSILLLSNIVEDGEPIGIYDGAAYWHTDISYDEDPAVATIVYSIKAPQAGGETLFANMFEAHAALPERLRRRVAGLTVLHHYGNRDDPVESSATAAQPLTDEQKRQVKNVYHPLVRPHPATGRPVLYAVAGSSFGIVGMPDDEAVDLLDQLKVHSTQSQFVYRHRYAVGDVVVWDNCSTLHSATPAQPATGREEERLLYRISCKSHARAEG